MKLVSTRVLAGAIGLLAATTTLPATSSADPVPPGQTVQTIGMDYSGFACPLQPVAAVPDISTTLAVTTETNFGSATFVVPSLNISVPLPVTLGTAFRYIYLGKLHRGDIPYEIDGQPATGSYGGSCHGVFRVGMSSMTS